MIHQDFASVFVGKQAVRKQAVRVKAVPIRENTAGKRIIWAVLSGALLTAITTSTIFCLLIRSGLKELAAQTAVKTEIVKTQEGLSAQRDALLDQDTLVRTAGKLGLYVPENHQVRNL